MAPREEDLSDNDSGSANPLGAQGDQPAQAVREPVVEGVDLSDVPEELRPRVEARLKEMRADYTRKTQEVSSERERLQQEAALGRLVSQNPNILKLLNGGASAAPEPQEDPDEEAAIQALEPTAVKAVDALLKRKLKEFNKQLDQAYSPVVQRFSKWEQRQVRSDWDALVKEFPEAAEHQADVAQYLQANPQVDDLRAAFMSSVGPKILEKRLAATRRNDTAQRRDAQILRDGTPAQQTRPKDEPKPSRLAAAFEQVLKKTGRT